MPHGPSKRRTLVHIGLGIVSGMRLCTERPSETVASENDLGFIRAVGDDRSLKTLFFLLETI